MMILNSDYRKVLSTGRQFDRPIMSWEARESRQAFTGIRNGLLISLAIWIAIFLACSVCRADQDWTDDEIINAIYKAEGGAKAQFPYGIRSVHCESKVECRKICENTVKKNRIRYSRYGHRSFASFIDFLASRFCPVEGRDLSPTERRLNGNWKRNVIFFLAKGRELKNQIKNVN